MTAPSLNPEQQQAVTHGTGPLLIIAGAGTGKTTVITERIKHLILKKEILPSEILALTFTEKAAREMEERVDVALPYGYTQMWISTFHAFCDRILREEAIHIGLDPSFDLATEAETILFLRKNLFQFDLQYFRPLGNPNKFIQGMLQHFSRLKDDDISPEAYLKYATKLSKNPEKDPEEIQKTLELANAFKTYEDLKAKAGIMDFSDLIANVLKLFRARPNVLREYQKKFKFILVDEFQDTNFAQNELAILLSGDDKNITVVGDDDQAIYRWRGAAIANIIQFREHFPNCHIITLTKNYRSTKTILDTSHKVIQNNNPDRLEIKENIDKRLLSMREKKGDSVEFLFAPRVEQEADLVTEKIQLLAEKKHFAWNEFAILIRANDHAQPFVRSLEAAGIPYQFLGPGHLFHQEEIKDLIAYMKVLYNFEDSVSLYRVLTHPIFELEARDIAAILNFSKKKNLFLFEALEQIDDTFLSDKVKGNIKNLTEMIKRHLARVPKDTAGQILYYFVEDSGLLKRFLKPETNLQEKQAQNIARFFEKLKTYETEHEDASIFAIVDWIELSMQLGESPLAADVDWSENNAVNILTVHSSKGLEFPVVFVVNLVTQRFPTRNRREQIPIPPELIRETLPEGDENLQEERRLFYVAMTRARDNLFLTAANYYGEGKRERKLSPFIYETFGEEYVKALQQKRKVEQENKQLSLLEVITKKEIVEDTPRIPGSTPVNYLSYSQISCFDSCPLHYKLRYLLKIPPSPSPALNFGTSVHSVLRDYYQALVKKEPVSKNTLETLLKTYWINEGYSSKSHEQTAYTHALKLLTEYTEHNVPISMPLSIEMPFLFTLGNLKVGGRIDRIDKLEDGLIEILDYKTGLNIPAEKDLLTDFQMTFYALAATEVKDTIFPKKPEEILLSLFFLEKNKKFSTVRTKEQLEEAKEKILKKAQEIAMSDFSCSGKNCKDCEYKILCQTYLN